MCNSSLSLALVVETYFLKRYAADIGVRVDKTKAPFEDLATFLDSSTRIGLDKTKVPVENSSVYPASSTDSPLIKLRYEWKMWLYFLILLLLRSF